MTMREDEAFTSGYSIGYTEEIVEVFAQRTAQKHAAYLIPYLKPEMLLLDCGCGPGSITADFAAILTEGHVVGIDIENSQLKQARQLAAQRQLANISFKQANIYRLPFSDGAFDIVHVHGLLCQLKHPELAVSELKRVVKPGGIVAAREPDFDAFLIQAENPLIARALYLIKQAICAIGGDYYIGKKLRQLFTVAGFTTTASASCESQGMQTAIWQFARCYLADWRYSPWGKWLIEKQLVSHQEILQFQAAFAALPEDTRAFFSLMWCEIIAIL